MVLVCRIARRTQALPTFSTSDWTWTRNRTPTETAISSRMRSTLANRVQSVSRSRLKLYSAIAGLAEENRGNRGMRGELNEVWIAARRRCSVVPSWRRHHGRDFQLDEF